MFKNYLIYKLHHAFLFNKDSCLISPAFLSIFLWIEYRNIIWEILRTNIILAYLFNTAGAWKVAGSTAYIVIYVTEQNEFLKCIHSAFVCDGLLCLLVLTALWSRTAIPKVSSAEPILGIAGP